MGMKSSAAAQIHADRVTQVGTLLKSIQQVQWVDGQPFHTESNVGSEGTGLRKGEGSERMVRQSTDPDLHSD